MSGSRVKDSHSKCSVREIDQVTSWLICTLFLSHELRPMDFVGIWIIFLEASCSVSFPRVSYHSNGKAMDQLDWSQQPVLSVPCLTPSCPAHSRIRSQQSWIIGGSRENSSGGQTSDSDITWPTSDIVAPWALGSQFESIPIEFGAAPPSWTRSSIYHSPSLSAPGEIGLEGLYG